MGNPMKQTKPLKGETRVMTPMTPEERQEAAARAYAQKRESIATGVLFNMMHNPAILESCNAEDIAAKAIEVADAMIEKLYFSKE